MSLAYANEATATHCGSEVLQGSWDRLAQAIRELFPHKTAQHLSHFAGIKTRAAEYFLSRKTSLSGDAYVSLLHSEHGFYVLRALMGDARPTWWRDLKAAAELEQIKRERDALNARIEAMERKP